MDKRPTNTTKPAKESISHKVGDGIEKAGKKIANAGAEKLGRSVYNAGDKIEHMNDNKKKTK